MNRKFKCILFDLDGTLIDSGPDLIDTLNYIFSKNNIGHVDKDIIGNLVGGGAEAMIRKGYKHLNIKINEKSLPLMIETFIEYYSKNCTKKTKLYEGVKEILAFLKKRLTICLCTNKKNFLANTILEELNIKSYFDYILGSDGKILLKPDISMPLKCIERFGFLGNESIFVGDSRNDIIPAKKLNMFSVFVNYGYGKLEKNVVPDLCIQKIIELKELV